MLLCFFFVFSDTILQCANFWGFYALIHNKIGFVVVEWAIGHIGKGRAHEDVILIKGIKGY